MFNGKKHLLITYFQFRRILEGFGIEKECRGPDLNQRNTRSSVWRPPRLGDRGLANKK